MQAPNSVMAYEKEFFHLRWREKKREKLQGGFPPLQTSERPYQIP